MTAIRLKINKPTHDSGYPDSTGSSVVTFQGEVVGLPKDLENVTLYYRWYSSINPDAAENNYALKELNKNPLTAPGEIFKKELGMGSHAITFGVSDRKGQTAADMSVIAHGGVAGGTGDLDKNDKGDGRCLIHVFKAKIIAPTEGALIQRKCALIAECPLIWWRIKSETQHELNQDYQKANRLKYRWVFERGGKFFKFEPKNDEFAYDKETFPSVSYTADLQKDMPGGEYTLTLYVEDKDRLLTGASASIKCTVPNVGAP